MKNKLFILVLALTYATYSFGVTPLETEINSGSSITPSTSNSPSESILDTDMRSIGSSMDVTTLVDAPRGLGTRGVNDLWDDPFLPGGEGWEIGGPGNVGYPLDVASFPIILSMLLIYFIYRGVTTSKRKNIF